MMINGGVIYIQILMIIFLKEDIDFNILEYQIYKKEINLKDYLK